MLYNLSNMTKKEQIFQFIESQPNGIARFTDIQEFVVDLKHGAGTYKAGKQLQTVYGFKNGQYTEAQRMLNIWRGQFSGGFGYNGYLMKGPEFLIPVKGGYKVKRKNS